MCVLWVELCNRVMEDEVIRVGPNPIWLMLIRRGKFGHREKKARGKWRQRLRLGLCCHEPRNTWGYHKLEEARKDLSLEAKEDAWPCQHLGLRLLAPRWWDNHLCGFETPSPGLLRPPWEMNTVHYTVFLSRGAGWPASGFLWMRYELLLGQAVEIWERSCYHSTSWLVLMHTGSKHFYQS